MFASVHSVLDFSNGASVATLDVLQGLTTRGFECQAFCTAKLDLQREVSFEKMIGDLHEPYQLRSSVCGADRAQILYTRRQQVPITFIRQESTRHSKPAPDEVRTVLRFFQKFLDVYQPDVLLTYGGDPITQGMIAAARRRGIPVVFAIHNFGYTDLRQFSAVDHCIVPSEFAGRHYREKVGLDCRVLPNPVDWERVRVADAEPRYLTFVNPALYKGAYPFVRIAQELGRRRPDIPLLVVESRATKAMLGFCGLRPADHPHIQVMPVTTDPRRFWRLTKVLLMPSLWWENQPLVAIEAMINGIPVIGSDRGGIPEALGDAGVLLPLPDRLTPESRILPTAEEVEPWVEAIIRLWDDPAWYQEQSDKARKQAERWRPERLRPLYAEFFRSVRARGGPPMAGPRLLSRPAGDPAAPDHTATIPLSFVVCGSDDAVLQANVLSSPCLHQGCPHEFTVIKNCPSAADGLNRGLERARHEWVVCLHQDVVLSEGWDRCLANQLREAERQFGTIGVAGVYGVGEAMPPREPGGAFSAARTGWVVDRGRVLRDGPELPARVTTLDELLLVVRRDAGLRFDPALGFHLYGADICLQAHERGLAVVALEALCHHNSRSVALPEAFFASAEVFARKWSQGMPVATPCAIIDHGGVASHVLGNATDQPESLCVCVVEPRMRVGRHDDQKWKAAEVPTAELTCRPENDSLTSAALSARTRERPESFLP